MTNVSISTTSNIERTIFAPAELVFDAWIKPELVHKWLFAHPDNDTEDVLIDPRAGGSFRIVEHDQHRDTTVTYEGVYTQINRPTGLAFSVTGPGITGEIQIEVAFAAVEKETTVRVTQNTTVPGEEPIDWKRMLQRLALTLENQ